MEKTAILVAGLAWGDEGKGACVDFLCRELEANLVVRYNGGSQAAHNVVTERKQHTFSQVGSGSFAGAETHLSKFMLVDPVTMARELTAIYEIGSNGYYPTVEQECLLITPFHKAANRLIETFRGEYAHGSCGMGIGVAREHQLKYPEQCLYASQCANIPISSPLSLIHTIQKYCMDLIEQKAEQMEVPRSQFDKTADWLTIFVPSNCNRFLDEIHKWRTMVRIVDSSYLPEKLWSAKTVIFEGAQGVLLDESVGISPPHVTWTDTTYNNAIRLLEGAGYTGNVHRIGCLRTYFTRHGNGPFPSEHSPGTRTLPEMHNTSTCFQGKFRTGTFDTQLARTSIHLLGGVDQICLSHLDYLPNLCVNNLLPIRISRLDSTVYDYLSVNPVEDLLEALGDQLNVAIGITASGPRARDREWRIPWKKAQLHKWKARSQAWRTP